MVIIMDWPEESKVSPLLPTTQARGDQPQGKAVVFSKCLLEISEASSSHASCSVLGFEGFSMKSLGILSWGPSCGGGVKVKALSSNSKECPPTLIYMSVFIGLIFGMNMESITKIY